MTTEQLKEIITAAHSLGAKKITIEGDKITIDWETCEEHRILAPCFPNGTEIKIPDIRKEADPPSRPSWPIIPEGVYAYAVPFPR